MFHKQDLLGMVKFRINNIPWTASLIDEDAFINEFGQNIQACCMNTQPAIFIKSSWLYPGVVRHELLHAYMRSIPIQSAMLDAFQIEEVIADIMNMSFDEYYLLSKSIYKELRKCKKRNG